MRAAEFMRALADIIDALEKGPQQEPSKDPSELDQNPVFVPPLQHELELKKAEAGKESPIINKLTQDEEEHDPRNPIHQS
jgi:hypothetical protein